MSEVRGKASVNCEMGLKVAVTFSEMESSSAKSREASI